MEQKVCKSLPIFSTVLKNRIDLNQKLTEVINSDYNENSKVRRNDSNVKAWSTGWLEHIRNNNYDDLIILTFKYLSKIEKEYMKVREPLPYKIHNLWAMKYVDGEYAIKHNHYPSDWSAVYYVDIEEKSSGIIFEEELTINPVPGMLLLFPSILDHRVLPTDGKRMVISMNIIKDFPHEPD